METQGFRAEDKDLKEGKKLTRKASPMPTPQGDSQKEIRRAKKCPRPKN